MFQTTNQCESSKFELIRAHLRMVVTLDDYKKHSLNMMSCSFTNVPNKKLQKKKQKRSVFHGQCSAAFQLVLEKWFYPLHVHLVTAVTDGHSHRQVTQEHLSGKEIPDNILLGFCWYPLVI
jgi:hypothetical protein